jgi:hypothetical protein
MNKSLFKLFILAFFQVMLVSMNVVFISKDYVLLLIITGFGISYTWSWNVKRISISNELDRFIYAIGAMCGTLFGYIFAKFLTEILK